MVVCEKCGGDGFILYKDVEGREWAKPCECRGRMIAEARIKASHMSEAFRLKTFEQFDTKNLKPLCVAKQKAIDYVKNFRDIERKRENSMLFVGQVGAGKTHLSIAAANKLMMEQSVSVVYMPYRETMTELKQLEYRDKAKYDKEMYRLSYARLLVIDDLFKGETDNKEINYIYQIINTRYNSNLPFIICTEKQYYDLLDIDEAIATRILEMARGHSVAFEDDIKLNHRINGGTDNGKSVHGSDDGQIQLAFGGSN